MGTNYYALAPECPNACEHCAQATEWHVCKSLVMFEAHEDSPWGPIGAWSDWKRILSEPGAPKIRDEYGSDWPADEFVAQVEATTPDARRRQYMWLVDHGYPLDRDYLDSFDFSWTRGEFS